MNRVLVYWLILLSSLPLVFSCGGGQQSSLTALQKQAIQWAEQRIGQQQLSTCLDSAYWIGICWNIYQLSKDSAFRIEAEKYLEPLYPIMEDTCLNADKAFRAYVAFAKGFEATATPRYRHKVWDLADCLMTDTTCVTPSTVEALLWGAAHRGCHCFKEAAIDWGMHQLTTDNLSAETAQSLGIMYLYTADTIYLQAYKAMNQKQLLKQAKDSLRQASVYARLDTLNAENCFRDKVIGILGKISLGESSSLKEGYHFTETLLILSADK